MSGAGRRSPARAAALGPVVVRELAERGWTVARGRRRRRAHRRARPTCATLHSADLLERRRARRRGRRRSARSTPCCTSSAAGAAASRSTRPTRPTSSCSTACCAAPSSTSRAPSRRALVAAGERGRFALVSSAQAQNPGAGNAAYAATKAAAEAWTLAFGRELAETRRDGEHRRRQRDRHRRAARGRARQGVQDVHRRRRGRGGARVRGVRRRAQDERPAPRAAPALAAEGARSSLHG